MHLRHIWASEVLQEVRLDIRTLALMPSPPPKDFQSQVKCQASRTASDFNWTCTILTLQNSKWVVWK